MTKVGRISGPEHSSRRRFQETLKVAQALHGATPDIFPAYEGIIAALNKNCSVSKLINMVRKCPKFNEKVIPRVVKSKLKVYEKSDANFLRSVNVPYRGRGVAG